MSNLSVLLKQQKKSNNNNGNAKKASQIRLEKINNNGGSLFFDSLDCFVSGYPVGIVLGDASDGNIVMVNNKRGAYIVAAMAEDAGMPVSYRL